MSDGFLLALTQFTSWQVIVGLLAGVLVGYLVGALPGLSASMGMALLIPFTFGLSPVVSIVMLVTLYMASEYSGATPAILCNTPGEPSAAITALDGYPMREQGRAGEALTLSILGSAFGSVISTLMLIALAQSMAGFALAFGPADYFALAVLGLSLISALAGNSLLRGLIGLLIGLLVATIGIDPVDGTTRFVFHQGLLSGISLVAALIGLFALSEVFEMLETSSSAPEPLQEVPDLAGQYALLWPHRWVMVRSTVIGFIIGVVPGAGATIASVTAYVAEKRLSGDPDSFGKGNAAGVVASETANNACIPGALAPMLALGIPGSGTAAILLGGLMVWGLNPGPLLFVEHKSFVWGTIASMYLGNVIGLVLVLSTVPIFASVLRVPFAAIAPMIVVSCAVGAYAVQNAMFDIWMMLGFGVLGYVLKKVGYPLAPLTLALVLGSRTEDSFRLSMIGSGGDLGVFWSNWLVGSITTLALVLLFWPALSSFMDRLRRSVGSPVNS